MNARQPDQRDALFKIMSGKHSAEGTLFHIFSLIVTQIYDPVFAPFEFTFDKDGRMAKNGSRDGVLETEVEPIKNPMTGTPHRIQVVMPDGFEHRQAEIASANIRSTRRHQVRHQRHAQLPGDRGADTSGCRRLKRRRVVA